MIDKKTKDWIDNASYTELLRKWRFSKVGDKMFSGSTGRYYREIMFKKRDEIGHDACVRASKFVGWNENVMSKEE